MVRNLTDPDGDDVIEWTEKVTDGDGDQVSVALELDAIDDGNGFTQQDTDASNVPWLSFSTRTNLLQSGDRETFLDIQADVTALTVGYKYRFEVTADDGIDTTSRTFILTIAEKLLYDGERLFMISNTMEEGSLSTPFDTTTLSNKENDYTGIPNLSSGFGFMFREDGTKLIIAEADANQLKEYDLSTPWDPSTATQVNTYSIQSQVRGLYVSPGGEHAYEWANSGSASIIQHNMSAGWDVSTAGQVGSFDTGLSFPNGGIFFKPDGTKLFYSGDNVYSHTLSTPWDISTVSGVVNSPNPTGNVERKKDIFFHPDGTKLFILERGVLFEFELTTSWDISTSNQLNAQDLGNLNYFKYQAFGLF